MDSNTNPASRLQLAELLLGQPAPAGGIPAAIARRGMVCLHGASVRIAGWGGVSETFQRLAVIVEPFRIVGAALGVNLQFVAGIGILARRDVDAAELAQHFAGAVTLVLADHNLEVGQRVGQASLFASHAPELEVGVGQRGIDGDGLLETVRGFSVLMALLVNQAELLLRFAIVLILHGGLKHAAKTLPAAQSRAQAGP